MEQAVAEIRELAKEVKRLADLVQTQLDRKSYQADYYKKRKASKAKKVRPGLVNRESAALSDQGRDMRLPTAKWGHVLQKFAESGASPCNFLTWLAWTWNKNTYRAAPITRSGGYNQMFIGFSGCDAEAKPLRSKYSDKDLFGCAKLQKFSNLVQLERFQNAPWWAWGRGVLAPVVNDLTEHAWWKQMPEHWRRTLLLMMGQYGSYDLGGGLIFEPDCACTDLNKASKMFQKARPHLEMGWRACIRGLFSSKEPFPDIINPEKSS